MDEDDGRRDSRAGMIRPAPTPIPSLPPADDWVRIGEDRGRPALLVGGVVQSVAPDFAADGYWTAMLPTHRPRRALLLGLGGGTVAQLLVRRFGAVPMVGVDNDPLVVEAARTAFGALPPSLAVVLADARTFVAGCRGRFDYVAVDLFRSSETPRGAFGQPFLRGVRAALTPGGVAVFNLFRDHHAERRVERLSDIFRLERSERVRENLVIHCRR
jgi:spermidine synthase